VRGSDTGSGVTIEKLNGGGLLAMYWHARDSQRYQWICLGTFFFFRNKLAVVFEVLSFLLLGCRSIGNLNVNVSEAVGFAFEERFAGVFVSVS